MADAAVAYEAWVGSDTIINGQAAGSSWDICQVGQVFLPGVVTVENLEVGRDIDVQKRRKKEKARLRDNGLSPVTFDIICELTAVDWPRWLQVLPYIQPKEGGTRTPLSIVHPMVNVYGVTTIYIHKLKLPAPSARKGMRIEIHCGEWFEEEKDTNGAKKGSFVRNSTQPDWFGDPATLAAQMAKNESRPGPGEDVDNVMQNAGLGTQSPTEPQPGEVGWHGFRNGSQAGAPTAAPKSFVKHPLQPFTL